MTHRLAFALSVPWLAAAASAQPVDVPFASPRWKIAAAESVVEEHLGRTSLRLKGGSAVLEDVAFFDGVIDFEMAFGPTRGFGGVAWRLQDRNNYEHFYLRPHQSGQPDALQYQPVIHGASAWQLYHGEGYGAAVDFPIDEWIPVRVVVSGDVAAFYVASKAPVVVSRLKREPQAGGLALIVGNLAAMHLSNFRYSLETPEALAQPKDPPPSPSGTVTQWSVSDAFAGATLDGRFALAASDRDGLRWHVLDAEQLGITNLARLQSHTEDGKDTAFARVVVTSSGARDTTVRFGYSDRVRVYLNGRLLYDGDNSYRSRDFRYLGTIGLFDSVPLALRDGENELLFAVSEAFGGWGIQALFPDTSGIAWR